MYQLINDVRFKIGGRGKKGGAFATVSSAYKVRRHIDLLVITIVLSLSIFIMCILKHDTCDMVIHVYHDLYTTARES